MMKIRMKGHIPILAIAFVIGISACTDQGTESFIDPDNYNRQEISSGDLAQWDFWGMGTAFESGNGQFCLMENDSTLGVVLISPDAYKGDVIVRYKTMALTSASVLVAMHSVSDKGTGGELKIPEDYNGNMGLWINEKDNYFYAFRNAPHNFTPFIRKYPVPGNEALGSAPENFMLPGTYYDVEFGRIGNTLWLNIDGKQIVEAVDDSILPGGHIVFRIRGSAGLKAACLIKDLVIYSAD